MKSTVLRWAAVPLVAAFAFRAFAWGPHSEITQAALDALGPDDALLKYLGLVNSRRLTHYCWLGDYRRVPYDRDGEFFYADDYLLFPGMTRHLDHLVPEVKQTYAPYFRRAVQALRTEDAANAARWIGSLLHFVEDTGSPPHSAEIRGDLHSKMENWVDAKKITIAGYKPRLLGRTEDEAVAGLIVRMDGLIAFSKERGERCRPLVAAGKRAEVEPIVLESAQETARVVADVLFTLGILVPAADSGARVPSGRHIMFPSSNSRVPTKIVLADTPYSTLTTNGVFDLLNLPGGYYDLKAFNDTYRYTNRVHVSEVGTFRGTFFVGWSMTIFGTAQNLVRNSDFSIRWLSKTAPDCWYRTKDGWEGELLPLKKDSNYELRLSWQTNAAADVIVRWRPSTHPGLPIVDSAPLKPGQTELKFTGSEKFAWAQVIIRTTNAPQTVLKSVSVSPAP